MNELVSVIIPTYNRASIIQDSIISVLNQTYKDIELLIIDDGSTDNTEAKIKEIHDNRIRYYKQINKGACAARNRGISLSKGEYIAFNDSDDVWYKNKIEHQIKVLHEKNADIVFGKLDMGVHKEVMPNHIKEGFLTQNTNLFGIGTQTLFCRKEVFDGILFDEDLPRLQDLELLIRMHSKYSIYCLNEKVVKYRIQQDSISKDMNKLSLALNLILERDSVYLNYMAETKGMLLEWLGSCKAYQGINDPVLFKESYKLRKRSLDIIKMIMAKWRILTLYYKKVKLKRK